MPLAYQIRKQMCKYSQEYKNTWNLFWKCYMNLKEKGFKSCLPWVSGYWTSNNWQILIVKTVTVKILKAIIEKTALRKFVLSNNLWMALKAWISKFSVDLLDGRSSKRSDREIPDDKLLADRLTKLLILIDTRKSCVLNQNTCSSKNILAKLWNFYTCYRTWK